MEPISEPTGDKPSGLKVGRFGAAWIIDEHGERRVAPGTYDPYTGLYYRESGDDPERPPIEPTLP